MLIGYDMRFMSPQTCTLSMAISCQFSVSCFSLHELNWASAYIRRARSRAPLACAECYFAHALCLFTPAPSAFAQEEFRLADEACSALLSAAGRADWSALLQPFPFFTTFKNYLQARHSTGMPPYCCCAAITSHTIRACVSPSDTAFPARKPSGICSRRSALLRLHCLLHGEMMPSFGTLWSGMISNQARN